MAITQLQSTSIADGAITTEKFSGDVSLSIKVSNVAISNSTYTVLDDTAVNVGGGYIVITGAGFQSGAQVLINREEATSVSFVDSTTLRAQVPAKDAGTYNLYVVNPDGGTAIRVNGLTYSGIPTWVTGSTLDNQAVDVAFNVAFDATGATSYANTTTLPAGTALLSNGYFYGTVTGIEEETTYNFTVAAIDDELQDSPRTFQVTVTVGPPPAELYMWGAFYTYGTLGLNDQVGRSSPVQVGTDTDWNNISVGDYTPVTTKTDGTLWTWGYNNGGQLGLNDRINTSSPVQVGSGTTWDKVSAGQNSTIATKTDGTLWSWGFNNSAQLGLNDRIYRSSPVQVGSDTDWNNISVGIATKTDGTLWTWGFNTNGQLGLNDRINRSSPVQVGSDTDWNNIRVGIATKTDGTLWTWGHNSYGSLGLNDTIHRSSPVQVGSGTTWDKVCIGTYGTTATKTDGTLWSWGRNWPGHLGLNDIIDRSSPVQVGTDTWNNISMGYYSAIATKTDGTLWSWGLNTNSQLGLNDKLYRSSPAQVGSGTTWDKVSIGTYNAIATKTV